jgi:magnesium-transporting ATPase (P-type)
MIHAGTTVLQGRALGVVTQTGVHTQVGRISQALTVAGAAAPLVQRLARFTRVIAIVFCAIIALLAVAEFLRGTEPTAIFFTAVALAVSAIPEGLPVAITIVLAIGTSRMARRRVVVRLLPAVEGLGACTLIASDKTGTLTCNELTIKRVFLPGASELEVGGEGYVPVGAVTRAGGGAPSAAAMQQLKRLCITGALCNEAGLSVTDTGYSHFGDTVDVAFHVLAGKLGLDRGELLEKYPEVGFIPFESYRRYGACFNRQGGEFIVHVKGAAEVVLAMCRGSGIDDIRAEVDRLAAEGYRVLAVASGEATAEAAAASDPGALRGLTLLGLVGIIDPVRPEVPEAVRRCAAAGIRVLMVTGDHPATALAIARQSGLASAEDEAVTGLDLAALADDPAETEALCGRARVFARVEPMQKLSIVEALQRAGHFVAVTGDGVNDAPALSAANIGVAMGREGTDAARGAADLILADDNFASIVNGIEEGRIAYDNLRKVVYLLISTGASEIVVFFLALAGGLPLPLFAVQLLWLNLVTNGIQHVALAFEKGEPDVLEREPRPPHQPIFDRRMVEQTVLSGAFMGIAGFFFFRWCLLNGWGEFEARNALLLLMVLFENVHVFNCRSENRSAFRTPFAANRFLFLAVAAAQGVHIVAMYVPGLRHILDIQPVSWETWLGVAGLSVLLLAVMEVYKLSLTVRRGTGGG